MNNKSALISGAGVRCRTALATWQAICTTDRELAALLFRLAEDVPNKNHQNAH
jgi:hypothetical protein